MSRAKEPGTSLNPSCTHARGSAHVQQVSRPLASRHKVGMVSSMPFGSTRSQTEMLKDDGGEGEGRGSGDEQ